MFVSIGGVVVLVLTVSAPVALAVAFTMVAFTVVGAMVVGALVVGAMVVGGRVVGDTVGAARAVRSHNIHAHLIFEPTLHTRHLGAIHGTPPALPVGDIEAAAASQDFRPPARFLPPDLAGVAS